jgi:nucleobase:cation symporter-1, NCS1 family
MAMSVARGDEVVYSDGRRELAPNVRAELEDSSLYNPDLAPVPIERRTWNTYNYFALWVGMAHNIPTYLLASGLIALGMDWKQALLTIALGNLLVLIPMLLNSHAGTKYGIPFPVFARASFGVFGANFAAILRGLIACGWFGIQTWIGGLAIFTLTGAVLGKGWTEATVLWGYPWTQWLSFLVFWVLNLFIILRGMETLRRFENWAAPFVLVVAVFLLIWMYNKANGFGPILFPALMGMIAFWSTLSLNMPDFTRFGGSQRQQAIGQILGLPTTMTFFSLIAVLITSATVVVYGEPIWDPIALTGRFSNNFVIVFALFTLVVATLSVNVAANVVSPSYDFSNAFPKLISFRTGGIITGVLGILIQPWRLLANPELYIFTWLEFYGGMLGAVAGILIADYWLLRRTELALGDLYRPTGSYRYTAGWNWRGLVAVITGMLLAVGGANSKPGGGPFPADGVIPFFKPLYSYSWIAGLLTAFLLYYILSVVFPVRRGERRRPAVARTGSAG